MNRVPDLIARNSMFRWGRDVGRREGIIGTLAAVVVLAIAAAVAWGALQ